MREALRDLELFGFVVSSPFRGTQVRKISTDDLLEIYPIRAALEGVAARAAAVRIDQATLEHLEELIGAMREAAARDDHRAEADADYSFHHAIVKASGNRMLEHVWQTMRLATTTCVTHSITHRSLHEIAERHVAGARGAALARSGPRRGRDAAAHRRARRVDPRRPPAGTGGHAPSRTSSRQPISRAFARLTASLGCKPHAELDDIAVRDRESPRRRPPARRRPATTCCGRAS